MILSEDKKEDKKIVKSFKTKDSLSQEIFERDGESFIMRDDVRKKLLLTCDNFLDTFDVEFFVHDVILTGSLANYNWSEYSDIDLHIILDMEEFSVEDKNQILLKNIFKDFFETKMDYWNTKHDIKIKNYDVEIYVQDLKEPHISTGVYSLVQNKWIIEPEKFNPKIDERQIIEKGEKIRKKIEILFKNVNDDNIINQIDTLKTKIKKFRKCGLEKGGEYSYENLTFKLIRRNGLLGKLIKLKTDSKDKKLSLNESPDQVWKKQSAEYDSDDAIIFGMYNQDMIIGFNEKYIPNDLYDKIKTIYFDQNKELYGKRVKHTYQYSYDVHPTVPVFNTILYELGIEKVDHRNNFKEHYDEHRKFWRTMFQYSGRLWLEEKIISFWDYPENYETLLNLLNKINEKLELIYRFKIDFSDFKIEVKVQGDPNNELDFDYNLIPISNYEKSEKLSDKELNIPHLLSPEEKKKHPQMVAAKQSDIKYLGKKENKWDSLAKRNYVLNKNVAEDKKNIK